MSSNASWHTLREELLEELEELEELPKGATLITTLSHQRGVGEYVAENPFDWMAS